MQKVKEKAQLPYVQGMNLLHATLSSSEDYVTFLAWKIGNLLLILLCEEIIILSPAD